MVINLVNITKIIYKYLNIGLLCSISSNMLLAININDYKVVVPIVNINFIKRLRTQVSMEIEDSIIRSNPQRLIHLLSTSYLGQDEKKYDLHLAKYISYKANVEMDKANRFSLKMLFSFFYFSFGSLFALYNFKLLSKDISIKEQEKLKSGIFCGAIVSIIGIEKIYKSFTKYEEKIKRNNAYAVETIIKNAKLDDYGNV